MSKSLRMSRITTKTVIYIACFFLAVLSIFPFWVMFMNATRSTYEIQQSSVALLPSRFFFSNLKILLGKSFNPLVGFLNSLTISAGATFFSVYFSSLTAYALVAYSWKMRQPFFTVIMCVLMIPAQVSSIGFYQFMYSLRLTNNFLPLILPAIASPAMVFFMRQYLMGALSLDIVSSARIDGAGEFYIFNRIVLPIMIPALATQAIFSFVASWNNLFLPLILLTDKTKYTMPIMVSLLRGDIYKTEFGSVYLGLSLTVLPLFIIYFLLSKYIISGVALGALKE
ncbi:carbohydrate ABC transporter permease [Parasphaerochaeta coccoides]|uniref:Carbohydrate ABC transporter membrane protein 2, CUT1 family n=1 Tax=Parasphaerochaeta coccoides (strain ATCC BAA-1237 / DSM 17374 / SPN1) TaxID=760011 RepID=F4GLH7_PARC1|nr:carbohydrate ABC transporter permease [Parasphaerochaeta coccoides]AEC01947.1 carbohydrate ABC transporter membrane protein 2, CUT1 family [Parasphaerochaeta coccoides DSM 17374]